MSRRPTLNADSRGLYNRRIGYTEGAEYQFKFYLGRLERPAVLANARLETLWEIVKKRAKRDGREPYWTDETLKIAKLVIAGEGFRLPTGECVREITSVAQLDDALSGTAGRVSREEAAEYHEREAEACEDALADVAGSFANILEKSGRKAKTGQTTHQAVNLYADWARAKFKDGEGVSLSGTVLIRKLDFIKRFLPDVDLGDFGAGKVEEVIQSIAIRPAAATNEKKGKRPISPAYAQKTISLFRRMLRWWNKSDVVRWRKPENLEFEAVRMKLTEEERAKRRSPLRVDYYTLDELKTLWQYATSYERLLMLLALNCGFGQGEIAQLRTSEVLLRKAHPRAKEINVLEDSGDSWIMRERGKTGAWGEWRLWAITERAIEWYQGERPECASPYLVVRQSGEPLNLATKSGNASQYVANMWQRLIDRVKKDKPEFRDLSFNKLRKTGATYISLQPGGGEAITSLYLGHGFSFSEDSNLRVYANAPWSRVFSSLRELRDYFRPIWESVAEPFGGEMVKKGGAKIGREKVREIQAMSKRGMGRTEIARKAGVSKETVRRWLKRM